MPSGPWPQALRLSALGWPGRRVRGSNAMSSLEIGMRCVPARRIVASVPRRGPGAAHSGRIAGLGRDIGEARDDGVGRPVADAGRAEGAVQGAGDVAHLVEDPVVGEPGGERARRTHRADSVGTRGADADREEVECRDVRCHISSLRSCSCTIHARMSTRAHECVGRAALRVRCANKQPGLTKPAEAT